MLGVASQVDGVTQGLLWTAAIGCDMDGPFIFRVDGWQLVPGHFAERHGLIVLIALGESIVALGVGAAVYEAVRFAEGCDQIRHPPRQPSRPDTRQRT